VSEYLYNHLEDEHKVVVVLKIDLPAWPAKMLEEKLLEAIHKCVEEK